SKGRRPSEGSTTLSQGNEDQLPTAECALTWVSDDPHDYDWALLEGVFSSYEEPPPVGVFLAYPSIHPDEPLSLSGAADRNPTSPRHGEPVPGVFRDEERYQALRKRRSEFQYQDRYLSEDEKSLSLSQLHRKWKDEAQKRANLRKESRPSDWDDLGYLEPEMMQWTKAAIRRVIWSRKQERWLERMRQLGVPVHTCDICSRQVTAQHQCVPTGLAVPGAKDTPYSRKEIVVAQQGKNLALKPKVVVDTGKLKDELHKMTAILADKDALAAQQEQFTEALIGLANALVADGNSGTASYELRGEPATTTGAERKEIPFTSERSDPPTTACQYESRRISRRRRSSTSFPLQFLPIHQDTK
ncbi:MAG: hypothetical protein KVP17_005228, partial [Porospora cf. gigantea B]|uniref:uncharacterized protein n=1 Tax=Porospora cf. gigantea B TaxID=2853592 RepID=UPI003571F3EA